MKVVIIEDEQFAARRLESMIQSYDASIIILAILESVEESVKWFRTNQQPDLIFLDIHLEDDISFAIFEKVQVSTPVIFTTAFDEYAIRAFKLKSIDYLLKPIVQEQLNNAISKYKEWNRPLPEVVDLSKLYELINKKEITYRERFSVSFGQKIKSFEMEEIAYFYSKEGLTFAVLNDQKHYPVDYSLDNLLSELNPKDFFRINRQYLIKHSSIKQVHIFPKSHLKLELLPKSNEDTFVSIDKVTAFKKWLGE
jgi:DNA-binding LytR/AlgR family response regulator